LRAGALSLAALRLSTAQCGSAFASGPEEYAIHDYEGFEGVTISEYAGIDTVARMGAFIA
jgi:antirestriction protein